MATKNLKEEVYKQISKIPKGQVMTYKELAKKVGKPKAIRAIATIVGLNPNPIIVPCHRVVKSDGRIGEYTYKGKRDKNMKIKLLLEEGVNVCGDRVI